MIRVGLVLLFLAATLAGPAVAQHVRTFDAGPIWNNDDARGKCPATCGKHGLGWTGDWRTVGFNRSTCDCAAGAETPPRPTGTSSCSVEPIGECEGCNVTCDGGARAECRSGRLYSDSSPDCAFESRCACR